MSCSKLTTASSLLHDECKLQTMLSQRPTLLLQLVHMQAECRPAAGTLHAVTAAASSRT